MTVIDLEVVAAAILILWAGRSRKSQATHSRAASHGRLGQTPALELQARSPPRAVPKAHLCSRIPCKSSSPTGEARGTVPSSHYPIYETSGEYNMPKKKIEKKDRLYVALYARRGAPKVPGLEDTSVRTPSVSAPSYRQRQGTAGPSWPAARRETKAAVGTSSTHGKTWFGREKPARGEAGLAARGG